MIPGSSPGVDTRRSASPESGRGERAFQALLACAFLKQQMDLRLATQQLTAHGRRLRSLADTQSDIRDRELDEVLALLAERTRIITGATGTAIALSGQRGVICRAASGNAPDIGAMIDPESGFSGLAILSGEILRCDDTQSDSRVDAPMCAQLGIRSLAAVPVLRRSNNVIGLLEVFSDKPHAFGDREIHVLRLLAGFILEAVQAATPASTSADGARTVATQVIPLPELPVKTPGTERSEKEPQAKTASVAEASGVASTNAECTDVEPNILAAPDEDVEATPWQAFRQKAIPLIVGVGVLLLIVASVWTWRYFAARRNATPQALPELKINEVVPALPSLQPASATIAQTPEVVSQAPVHPAAPPKTPVQRELPKVLDIRHWSTPEASMVVIELEREVPFISHRLHAPERIYFDVQGSQLGPALKDKSFEISDGIVEKIRVASPQSEVSRIVLDTKGEHEYTTSVATHPYRVIIEVRK